MELTDSINVIKGIGEKTQKLFEKVSVFSVGELLTYYPERYDTFKDPVEISMLRDGDTGVICASVSKISEPSYRSPKKILTCTATDTGGSIELIWFNQPYIRKELKIGYHFIFRGKVKKKGNRLSMDQPKVYKREDYAMLQKTLQPVYSLTAGLSNNTVRKAMQQAMALSVDFPNYIPDAVNKEFGLIKKSKALEEIHFPKSTETLLEARRSLVFEEFFLFRVFLNLMSPAKRNKIPGIKLIDDGTSQEFIEKLPYSLTEDQNKTISEIRSDIASGNVMARLVQGDVGSGKTVIAELALLITAKNGYQGLVMAPTEVLANQHYKEMKSRLEPFGVKVCLLTGSLTKKEKNEAYKAIEAHEVQVIVGTHALFQEKVIYDRLALCITDEQHRFGVRQREALSAKGEKTHILVMSATPIPRTLAMMMYGDMDISTIKQLPSERLPIKNCLVGHEYRPTAYNFIKKQVSEGRQAYVICPMVSENEDSNMENVTDYSKNLQEILGKDVVVGKLHGKMKPEEKDRIMREFSEDKIDVLVSTTVVEVGVNVPNATVMMIENAERFGLAQLHQLRGRIGRGKWQSYCIFMYGQESDEIKKRLDILLKSNDGFYIASEDLKMRGSGDIFGIRQCGEMYFKIGDIYNDADVFTEAAKAADSITEKEFDRISDRLLEDSAKQVFQFLNNYVTI